MASIESERFKGNDAHLFVLVHGLWGGPSHMCTLEDTIKQVTENANINETIVTLRPSSFRFWKTYDGIKLCALRVISELLYEIEMLQSQEGLTVTKISFIAYSLGGLISRYAIGVLEDMGFFEVIEPVIFTTFATPHLGVHFYQNNVFGPIANTLGPNLFGTSGKQLFISDKEKLVKKLADPQQIYFQGLKKFSKHILLANIRYDRSVAFYTSFITNYSPFDEWEKVKIKYLKNLPEIQIGSNVARPEFVDLERTHSIASQKSVNHNFQQGTSLIRANKFIYFSILILLCLFFFPIWIPFILISTSIATAISNIKIRLINSPDVKGHWQNIINSRGDNKVNHKNLEKGQSNRKKRHEIDNKESFKKDTSNTAKNALEGIMNIGQRMKDDNQVNDQNEQEQEQELELNQSDQSDQLITSANSQNTETEGFIAKKSNSLVRVDLIANEKCVITYLSNLKNKDYSKYPIFTDNSILKLDEDREFIMNSLNSLDWIKIPVYIDAWNAHDGIVARRGATTNPRGTATVYLWASIVKLCLESRIE